MNSKRLFILTFLVALIQNTICHSEVLRYHTVVLDNQNRILPWYSPGANAYDQYLKQLWGYIPTVLNGPSSSL